MRVVASTAFSAIPHATASVRLSSMRARSTTRPVTLPAMNASAGTT